MADIDYTPYLAARREQQQRPVTVTIFDRDVTFHPVNSAVPFIDAAITSTDVDTAQTVVEFYRASLKPEDLQYLRDLAANEKNGFDNDAFGTLYTKVMEVVAGRPTPPSSISSE